MNDTQCIDPDCDRVATKRDWCNMHYKRLVKQGLLPPLVRVTQCKVAGCTNGGRFSHGMCGMHNARMNRFGTTDLQPRIPTPTAERLAAGLERKSSGCLEWTGATYPQGYGFIKIADRNVATHRLAWTLANGPIPEGLLVCHHCDNPPCCETEPTEGFPDGHLFLGTNEDNMADMVAKGRVVSAGAAKTHCENGHPLDDEANVRVTPDGHRRCLVCHRAANARYYARKNSH